MSTPALAYGYTITFTAAGQTNAFSPEKLTRVTLNRAASFGQRQRVSIAHLGDSTSTVTLVNGVSTPARREEPYVEIWQPRGGAGGTLDIEFIGGSTLLVSGKSGTLNVAGGGLSYTASNVTVASSQMTLSVGDIIRGQASFALPPKPPSDCSC